MKKEILHQAIRPQSQQVEVVRSLLGKNTGIIGAYELAVENYN